jgi:hypothetical protein
MENTGGNTTEFHAASQNGKQGATRQMFASITVPIARAEWSTRIPNHEPEQTGCRTHRRKLTLHRLLGQVTAGRAWLKKIAGRKALLDRPGRDLSLRTRCDLPGINRSGLYYEPDIVSGSEIQHGQ